MVSTRCLKSEEQGMAAARTDEKMQRKVQVEGPDGTSAWIVAVAVCLINFIMAGLGRMSGILFVAFIETYGVGRKKASMPSSVRSSARNLLGPVVGILGQKYGARSITIIGGIVATTSAVTCFFAEDITWITILWGGLNGLGNALTVTLPQVVIGQYFDKYKTTASGMTFSGGCLGSFVFPVLLETLIHEYGLNGTFLILGGIIMHTIPAAMILRKPSWLKTKKETPDVEVPKIKLSLEKCYESDVRKELVRMGTIDDVPRSEPNLNILRQNSEVVIKLLAIVSAKGTEWTNCTDINEKSRMHLESYMWAELYDVFKSIEEPETDLHQNLARTRQDVFSYEKEPLKPVVGTRQYLAVEQPIAPSILKRCRSVPDLAKASNSNCNILHKLKDLYEMKLSDILAVCPKENKRTLLRVSRELKKLYHHVSARLGTFGKPTEDANDDLYNKTDKHLDGGHSNSILGLVLTAFKLYTKPMFLLICLCRAVHFIAFIPTMTTVVDFVMDKGFLEQDGKYAIAALSLGDLVGRLCFGWVTDKGYLSMSKYIMIVMMAQGTSTFFLPLMHTRITLFFLLAIFGLLQGSLYVRHPVLISKYMDSHEQSIAMGCVNFISGILGFGMPAYIGFFRDTLGSYNYIFHINGMMGACVGLLWILEPYILRRSARRMDKPDYDKV
ncbi:monocarboxylate transporter 5 [Trichonephila clavata]|uniref:Monocarboxylate transporter 5 n=1 Tax=Trichonephila clavata TaxID=2740835 RepID=A0A8X6LNH6_TRICU|nr:monocarboxylate transporter 5 [Trichonephila clavata]